jgi:hypothetical protein
MLKYRSEVRFQLQGHPGNSIEKNKQRFHDKVLAGIAAKTFPIYQHLYIFI